MRTSLVLTAVASLVLPGFAPSAFAQYRAPRDYLKRIEPLVPPSTSPARPGPAQAGPAQPAPAQLQPAARKLDPEKAKAERDATIQRSVAFDKKQAEAGSPMAQYDLGMRYLNGDGVEQNTDSALRWLEAAAKQGNTKAVRKLQELKKAEETRKQEEAQRLRVKRTPDMTEKHVE